MKAGAGLVESDRDQFGITRWRALHRKPMRVFRRAGLGPADVKADEMRSAVRVKDIRIPCME